MWGQVGQFKRERHQSTILAGDAPRGLCDLFSSRTEPVLYTRHRGRCFRVQVVSLTLELLLLEGGQEEGGTWENVIK